MIVEMDAVSAYPEKMPKPGQWAKKPTLRRGPFYSKKITAITGGYLDSLPARARAEVLGILGDPDNSSWAIRLAGQKWGE